MINNQLLDYIRHELFQNVSKEVIISNLKSQGWNDSDIAEAFSALAVIPQIPVAPSEANPISSQLVQSNNPNKISNFKNSLSTFVHKHKTIFSIVIVLVCVAVLGGGAYGYYSGMFISLPSLTSKAIDSVRAANSATFDSTLTVDISEMGDITGGLGELLPINIIPTKFSLTTKGEYDFSEKENKKAASLVSLNAGTFSTVVDIKMVNNILYGKLVKVPDISFFLSNLDQYKDKWFSFPIKSEDPESFSGAMNPISMVFGIDPSVLEKITPEQKEHLYQMLRNAHLVKTVEKLPPEVINDTLSYHFLFDLDREGIKGYFQSLKDYVNEIGKNDSSLSAFDPTSFTANLDEIQDFQGEIWIGRKDGLPYKASLSFAVQPDKEKESKLKINVISIFGEWNKSRNVVAPEESTPFESFITGSLGEAREKGALSAIKAHLSNLRATSEIFYDANTPNSYLGLCSSKYIKNTQKEIEMTGGADFICKDALQKYAISVKLPENAGYQCIDSTGFNQTIKTRLTSTVCPQK